VGTDDLLGLHRSADDTDVFIGSPEAGLSPCPHRMRCIRVKINAAMIMENS
jgi:hypothetical protein